MMRSDDNSLALSYVLGRAWIMLILVCVGTSCLSQSSGRKPRSLDLELRNVTEFRKVKNQEVRSIFRTADLLVEVEEVRGNYIYDNLGRNLSTFIAVEDIGVICELGALAVGSMSSLARRLLWQGESLVRIDDVEIIDDQFVLDGSARRLVVSFISQESSVSGLMVCYFVQPYGEKWIPAMSAIPVVSDAGNSTDAKRWYIIFNHMFFEENILESERRFNSEFRVQRRGDVFILEPR